MSAPTTPTLTLGGSATLPRGHDSPSNSSLSGFGDIALDSMDTPRRTTQPPTSLPGNLDSMPPATCTVPLSTPTPSLNGGDSSPRVAKPSQSKIDSIKQWSISAYKCTRQILQEKLGKGSRTVDVELEARIESLRETQRKYQHVLRLARMLSSHFCQVVQTQGALGEALGELANRSPELHREFSVNAETQRTVAKHGETLLAALNFFTSSLSTLCNKTMEDTLLTIRQFENARLEYDAYRCDLEELSANSRPDAASSRVEEARRLYTLHKERYEALRADVGVKMKFLDENRVKVMHKQLLLLHNAVSAYFSGNQTALEAALQQFNIKLRSPNSSGPSWLEHP